MIRDILMFASEGLLNAPAFALPLALSKRFGARLSAVHVMPPPYLPVTMDPGVPSTQLVEAAIAEARHSAAISARQYKDLHDLHGFQGSWHTTAFFEDAIALGYGHDFLVVAQDTSAIPEMMSEQTPGRIATSLGRPTLIVPANGTFETCGHRVLVAWKSTKESARAVHDAMTIMQPAAEVTVLEVDPPTKPRTVHAVAEHIGRHGFSVNCKTVQSGDKSVTKVILDTAKAVNADLIVMGAYSHSRLREMVLGGVTKSMLRETTLPVLMSH